MIQGILLFTMDPLSAKKGFTISEKPLVVSLHFLEMCDFWYLNAELKSICFLLSIFLQQFIRYCGLKLKSKTNFSTIENHNLYHKIS